MSSRSQFDYNRLKLTRDRDVGASRIEQAGKGPKSDRLAKLALIKEYIRVEAALRFGGDARRVPCPTREEWSRLASGRHATLPSEGQLTLYADDVTRRVAARLGGDLRRAYFALARRELLK